MVGRHRVAVLLIGAAFVTLSAACKPRVGGRCSPGQAACLDGRTGLFCGSDGDYRAIACRGFLGCKRQGARISCDQSLASLGSACTRPGFACSSDTKNSLYCNGDEFVLAGTCSGPGGCKVVLEEIQCDNDVASEGDPCFDEGDYACSAEGTSALKCVGKEMHTIGRCRGPGQCRITHSKPKVSDVECDMSIDDAGGGRAVEGD